MEPAPLEKGWLRGRLRALQVVYLGQTYTIVLARVLAYSWVLHELGSGNLPWVFLGQALPLCLLSFALIGVVDRVGRASLITAGSVVMGVGVLLFRVGAGMGIHGLSAGFLLFGETLFALFGVHFWLLASELLSPRESKRYVSSLALLGAVGAILAGLTAQGIGQWAPWQVLPVLLPSVVVTGVAAGYVHRTYRHRVAPASDLGGRGWAEELVQGVRQVRESAFLRWLVLFTAGITTAGVIVDYLYSVAAERLSPGGGLPAFLGGINVVINVLQVILVLLVGRRIFTTVGLVRTLSSFPAGGTLLGLLTLINGPGWTAVALKVFDRLENYLVLNPGVGIALNAFDREKRGRASLVYGGVVKPLSISLTGLLLLEAHRPLSATLLLLMVLALTWAALQPLGRAYRRTLVENLRAGDPRLVRNSLEALSEPENRSVTPTLLAFYRLTQDPVFRENVLKAAGQIQDPAFVPILLEALRGAHTSLKCAAAGSLTRFPCPQVRDALMEALKNENSTRVKASILSALRRGFDATVHVPALLAGLEDPDPRVRSNAIEAIGLTRDPALIRRLRPYLESPYPRVKANAVIALAQVPSERPVAVRALEGFFEQGDRALLLSALHAAGELRAPSVYDRVKAAAASEDPDVRRNAVIALGKYDDPEAVSPLLDLLVASTGHGVPVAHALDRLGEEVREALIARLVDLPAAQRAKVVRVIQRCGVNYPDLVDRLERAGGDLEAEVPILLDTAPTRP